MEIKLLCQDPISHLNPDALSLEDCEKISLGPYKRSHQERAPFIYSLAKVLYAVKSAPVNSADSEDDSSDTTSEDEPVADGGATDSEDSAQYGDQQFSLFEDYMPEDKQRPK